ncbi:polyamine ABC transporter ATP-binding protein [Phyllobacterium phragmitis]|uniref:Polyamine ABC transporter ATP-binding protein n=1 Tax=Phyllobacterium phragmitis TaxID=2670329 RepID=A0A2S9IND3_9HYPH|nr:ABC transporter ATP-binding protein [Phyllobacterium phragmitis]PRD42002.1 polyamine ABC transporter ATP-binding protein [Phyllobacterium phragmitis]
MQAVATETGAESRPKALPVAVSVKDVSMVFDGFHAVHSASFELPTGKFLTILGPSGSGKTTLLRLIAGFQRPTSGEIFINGEAVNAVPPHKRSIGMVFQKLALFPHMTAAENVAFPLKMRRRDARSIPERVERYLDLVKLGGFGTRRVHELSGGQQQRVAIARALVFEPDLLLLDEPLAALDRKLREEMQLEFRRIQRELGVTTINVTHDQREALVVSDEVIVMDGGRIQQKARPSETYRNPSNAFVAHFIGVTNFITGTVRSLASRDVVFVQGENALPGVVGDASNPPKAGGTALGAIRAEQIRMAGDAAALAGLDMVQQGTIADAIFEGERVVYEVRVPSLGDALFRVFDHDPVAHTQFEQGAAVHLGWNARDMLVFDK